MTKQKFIGEELLDGVRHASNPYVYNNQVIGNPFNLQDVINKLGKQIIPSCLGIYHLFYDDRLVYIGMSKNIRSRLLNHLRDEEMIFDNVLWFTYNNMFDDRDATIEDVLKIERRMIKALRPPLNTAYISSY